jgi:hypothetical protein
MYVSGSVFLHNLNTQAFHETWLYQCLIKHIAFLF